MIPLQLRPLRPDDLDRLVLLDSDPEVMRYINGGQPTPRALARDVLLPRMLAAASQPGLGFFALVSDEDPFLGWAHLRRDSFEPAWAEIGYRLARRWWGRGIATEVSRQLRDRAWDELGFQVVSARTMPDNLGSRRVMEKIGLRYTGDFVFPARELPGMSLPAVPGVLYVGEKDNR